MSVEKGFKGYIDSIINYVHKDPKPFNLIEFMDEAIKLNDIQKKKQIKEYHSRNFKKK